jgi:anaerobic magnesium-protoporphyrin IX monomethyl ester cyclase
MRICLLTCRAPFLIDERVFPPLGLIAVGNALRQQGHEVVIRDEPEDADAYGIGPTTPEYPYAMQMRQQVAGKLVIGGPHASVNPTQCLDDGFDAVVLGDGELAAERAFFGEGVVSAPELPLDEYPFEDRSLLDLSRYNYRINGRPATTLLTSRGCPYRCAFCSKSSSRTRFKSAERVCQEIDHLHGLGYRALMFFDDTFILRRNRVVQICEHLKELGILWRCFVRADLIVKYGRNFAEMLLDAGCVEVGIGIESGSDRILLIISKGETTEDIRDAIALLRQAGIRVKGFFIIGLPGEDQTTLGDTMEFICNTPLDDADFTIFQPYAGSPIVDNKEAYDTKWTEAAEHYKGKPGEHKCVVRTSALSASEIIAARDELEATWTCL